ncbi:MAG TPA: hypothetical protein VHQ87_07450 [Rhizobacter sp.]|jgi:hypothetical protein|nr:hypothetical protein [Rhizobacter sp.]
MRRTTLILALLTWPVLSLAQTLYRCGNTYSQTPCAADAASAHLSAGVAPDVAPGLSGKDLCATEGVIQLGFSDPESRRVGAVTRAGSEAIPYAGKAIAVRKYHLNINAKNAAGMYTGEQTYVCYLSEDERRVLKVDLLRR